jgi:hypothetical protein
VTVEAGVIVEGVTGAGKTSTIASLSSISTFRLVGEDETFGDFMPAFDADPESASERASQRLACIVDGIDAGPKSGRYVLERFHFSQIALGSDWRRYRDVDRRLAVAGFKVVVLVIPEEHLRMRSLYRAERGNADWQDFLGRYGSERSAVDAIRRSQAARLAALKDSALEHRAIDTTAASWDVYAAGIADWLGW